MANYTRVEREERDEIEQLLKEGVSVPQIAKRLGRDPSTLYRERKRNVNMMGNYVAQRANDLAEHRRRKPRKRKIEKIPLLKEYIAEHLRESWSPEQISGRLKLEGRPYTVCAETIYSFIHSKQSGSEHREWRKLLPRKKCRRTRRGGRRSHTKRLIAQQCHISQRPAEVETREVLGHWEGDTIRFSKSRKANVTTLAERVSRLLLLIKNEDGRSKTVVSGIKNVMECSYPKTKIFKSMTFDQGSEFVRHWLLDEYLRDGVYFCNPGSPQQRGTNENTNGRLRRDLPRDIDIDQMTQEQLNAIAEKHNNRPRKCLGWATPIEVYLREYGKKSKWPQIGPHILKPKWRPQWKPTLKT